MILNPYISHMLRSDLPIKSYNSLHILPRPRGFRSPMLNFFLSECFPLGPVLIYRQLPSDWYWKTQTYASTGNNWSKIHIFCIGQRGFSSPPRFFFYPNAFPSDQYWSTDHYLQVGTEKETIWNDWRKIRIFRLFRKKDLEPPRFYVQYTL